MSSRTEKDKMLAGDAYNFFDVALGEERKKAKRLLRLYNLTQEGSARRPVLERLLGAIGRESIIEPPFYCTYGRNTYLGDHVYLNVSCVIIDNNEVRIGHHAMIGPLVQIYTAAHLLGATARNEGWEVAKPIVIEDNVWIGGGAILLPGVRVGRNAVVGAGAVVSRSVPPDTVVAGNPARIIREIDQEESGCA